MVAATATQQSPNVALQGILVPQSSINPQQFFERTRRLRTRQDSFAISSFGGTYNKSLLQTGIISGLWLKFAGTVTVTLAAGTCASTMRWPYGLVKNARFSANGQSNLINTGGWSLKAREMMQRGDLNDRGVSRGIGGASPGTATTQGTLSLNNESWGIGQNVTAIAGAPTAYPVKLAWFLPVAMDKVTLTGAIFAQTSSTDLSLNVDFAPTTELFTLTGAATVAIAGTFTLEAELATIPMAPDGGIVVPDLSVFHSIITTRFASPSNGMNEIRLSGQGVGRSLQRLWFQTFNGATPAPLAVNATNYVNVGWRYGGNDTPEVWQDGESLAYWDEDLFSVDFATSQGFAVLDWASEYAYRDAIDEGAATELRLLAEIASGVALTSPFIEYTQETLFAGTVGA